MTMRKIAKAQKGAIWLDFLEKASAINENRSRLGRNLNWFSKIWFRRPEHAIIGFDSFSEFRRF